MVSLEKMLVPMILGAGVVVNVMGPLTVPKSPGYIFYGQIGIEHAAIYQDEFHPKNLVLEVTDSPNEEVHPALFVDARAFLRGQPIGRPDSQVTFYYFEEGGQLVSKGIIRNGEIKTTEKNTPEAQTRLEDYLRRIDAIQGK